MFAGVYQYSNTDLLRVFAAHADRQTLGNWMTIDRSERINYIIGKTVNYISGGRKSWNSDVRQACDHGGFEDYPSCGELANPGE